MEKIDEQTAKDFYSAVLSLENIDECKAFFEDICTIRELQDLSQRLQVALLLSMGKNCRRRNACGV